MLRYKPLCDKSPRQRPPRVVERRFVELRDAALADNKDVLPDGKNVQDVRIELPLEPRIERRVKDEHHAARADFDKVRAALGEEAEAVAVDDIALGEPLWLYAVLSLWCSFQSLAVGECVAHSVAQLYVAVVNWIVDDGFFGLNCKFVGILVGVFRCRMHPVLFVQSAIPARRV